MSARRVEEFLGVADLNQTVSVKLFSVFWSVVIVILPVVFTYRMAGELQVAYRETACAGRSDKCICLKETVRV